MWFHLAPSSLATPSAAFKATFSVALVAIHVIMRGLDVESDLDWQQMVKRIRTWMDRCGGKASRVQAATDDLKLRYFDKTLRVARALLGLDVVMGIFMWAGGRATFLTHDGQGYLILSWYCLSLAIGTKLLPTRLWQADIAAYFVFLTLEIRVLTFPPHSPLFFINHSQRLIACLYAGLLFFDYRKAIVCSGILAWSTVYIFRGQVEAFPDQTGLLKACQDTEIMCCCFSALLFYLLERRIDDGLFAEMDKEAAETSRHAAQRLLSVLCDADVVLGYDLQILGRAVKLSHMLPIALPHNEQLEGVIFPSLLADEDKPRFIDFIRASSLCMQDPQSKHLKDHVARVGPPTSLQVSLHSSPGSLRKEVEIFHAVVPDAREPNRSCHLLGLRECCDFVAVPLEKESQPAALEKESHPAVLAAEGPISASSLSAALPPGSSPPWSSLSAALPPLAAELPLQNCRAESRSSSESSRHSSRSAESGTSSREGGKLRQMLQHPLPQIAAIELGVLLRPAGMPIESLTILFDLKAYEGVYSGQRPDLQTWLRGSARDTLSCWLQSQVNRFIHEDSCEKHGPAQMRAPLPGLNTRIVAADVAMNWAEMDDDGAIRAEVQFRQLSECLPAGSKAVAELRKPMPRINES